MDPQIISADSDQRAPPARFRASVFSRILALVWPFRGKLALGILASIGFAGLQTASIGVVYPVFKILLEDEGLHGWADRMITGNRLGVDFGPPVNHEWLRVTAVHDDRQGLHLDDHIADARGRPVDDMLHELAGAEPGDTLTALVLSQGEQRAIELTPGPPRTGTRLLRTFLSLIPTAAVQNRLHTLAYVLAGLVLAGVLGNLCRYFGEILIAKTILRALMDLRERLYERTLRLPMTFFAGQPTADIVTRFVQDIQEIQRGLITLFGKAIREPLRAVFILGLAFVLDWRITLTMAVVAPIAVAVFWGVGRRVKKANRKLLQAYGVMIGALTASLHNLRVVKAYTAEEQEEERLNRVDLAMFKQQVKLARLDAFIGPMMEIVAVTAGSVVTVWLASRVLNHELSPAKFMTLGVTLSMLFDPLRKLTDVYVRVQRSTAGAERIFQVMDQPIEADLPRADIELQPLAREIEYASVTFTYPGAAAPALVDINLTIRKGETVALVGPNGCGKTTLVSLLPRLFDPDVGEIRYDGQDIRRATLPSLRRQISLVSQEAIVFAGTPLENITYGNVKTSKRQNVKTSQINLEPDGAIAAARRAYADDFLRALPGGYEADLGERGTTLSGGQRQRLAIARAIYRDAPVLIFDEATSQIDSESELKIQTALREFAKGRTTIIVAHRLSTIQFANRIIVMDAGRIIDSGTHRELFDRCPLYRTLCETQLVEKVS